MNKAFKTDHKNKIARLNEMSDMKRRAFMSCHTLVSKAILIQDHPLKDEISKIVRSGKVMIS